MTTPNGWFTTRTTAALHDRLSDLFVGRDPVVAVGLPRYSKEQSDTVKGATKFVREVVATYDELSPFQGITEEQIQTEGIEIRVEDLAPSPDAVRLARHVGWVLRRGDALLAMIDASAVDMHLQLHGVGKANATSQLMIQLHDLARHFSDGAPVPKMLMPQDQDRQGRIAAEMRKVKVYAGEVFAPLYFGGDLYDPTDVGHLIGGDVEERLAEASPKKNKLRGHVTAIQKYAAGENGQLAEQKLPFGLRYRRDERGRPVTGPTNGTVIEHSDDPTVIATVQAIVRGLAAGQDWTTIGATVAEINPPLPALDADGNVRRFAELDDWGVGVKAFVTTKSATRPATDKYLFATLTLWRTGRWPTVRSVGDGLPGYVELDVKGVGVLPIVTPKQGKRYIECEARWDRWSAGDDGEQLVAYGIDDATHQRAWDTATDKRRRGAAGQQRSDGSTLKLLGALSPQPLGDSDGDLELRVYANGTGRNAALHLAQAEPDDNRAKATRLCRIPLGRAVRALAVAATDAVADALIDPAPIDGPSSDEKKTAAARAGVAVSQAEAEVQRLTAEMKRASAAAVGAKTDTLREQYEASANERAVQLEEAKHQLTATKRAAERVEDDPVGTTDVLQLADVLAVGVKSTDGTAPAALARRFLGLFDWSSWCWDTDTVEQDAPVRATVTAVVPLTDGTTARLPVEVIVRSSEPSGSADPALRAEQVLLHGRTLDQVASIESISRESLIAHVNPWLRERGCTLPLAVLDTPHDEVRQTAWAIVTDDADDADPLVERVREAYFTDGASWPNQAFTGTHVDAPHDQTLAQTVLNSLLRLRRPADGAHEDDVIAALGCDHTTFQREVLGWSGGSQRLGRPALVERHDDGRITPRPCMNPDCHGRGFASTARWTPLTQPWGLVCPTCGHVPDPEMRYGSLPVSFRTPTTDEAVSLTTAVRHVTVPTLARELDTSEHLIGVVLEEETLPFRWDGPVRRVPVTVQDRIAAALDSRGDHDLPDGVLTVPEVADQLRLTAEQVRHHTRVGRINRRSEDTPTGGWTYDADHIDQLVNDDVLTAFRADTISAGDFADMLGLDRARDLYAVLDDDSGAPAGYDAGRGRRRWLTAEARAYAAAQRAAA